MVGRPSDFTPEIAERICELIIESDFGLEQICDANDDLPSVRTVFRWLAAHESFRHQYALARECQGHVQFGRATKSALEAKDAGLGRLAFDARKWSASKLNPKVYSDRVDLNHSGEIITMTPAQRAARIAALVAKAAGSDADRSGGA